MEWRGVWALSGKGGQGSSAVEIRLAGRMKSEREEGARTGRSESLLRCRWNIGTWSSWIHLSSKQQHRRCVDCPLRYCNTQILLLKSTAR